MGKRVRVFLEWFPVRAFYATAIPGLGLGPG
jgi:hypothetical protein